MRPAILQEISPPQTMEELLIKRPCILVQDLERSLMLYRDILGFTPTYSSAADADSYLYKLFDLPPSTQLTFVSCDTPTAKRALAITEAKNLGADYFIPPARIALVVQVKSVPNVIAKIQSLNLPTLSPNEFQTQTGSIFVEQGLQDFDNNRLILYSSHGVSPDTSSE